MSELKLNTLAIGPADAAPLIALHGWGQSLSSLQPLCELLADVRRIHFIDLPGHGASEIPPGAWGTEEYCAAVLEYLDRNDIAAADFLGHSFGGKISLYTAAKFPSRVKKLILMGASGIPGNFGWKRRVRIYTIKTLRGVLKPLQKYFKIPLYTSWFIPRYASPDYQNAGPMRGVLVRIVNENMTSLLSSISAPTLCLWGELDTETPVDSGERMSRTIPGAKLIVLPGKDHYVFSGAGASVCAYHIKQFLESGS